MLGGLLLILPQSEGIASMTVPKSPALDGMLVFLGLVIAITVPNVVFGVAPPPQQR